MPPTNHHTDVEELLLKLSEFGQYISGHLLAAAGDPDLVDNLSVIVLATLDLHGPQRPGDLQDRTRLSSGGVTKLVDRLQDKGLVDRSYGAIPEDHRGVLVSLTPVGREQIQAMAAALGRHVPETATLLKEMDRLIGK